MQRRMNINTNMNAVWEIISTAEYVEELDRDVTNEDMVAIYQGNFVPLMLDDRTSRKQLWHVVITTVAEADDGTRHTHEMEWQFDKPMLMKEVLDGAKHIKVNRDGMKLRWKGLAREWTATVDSDLAGLTAVSAWAVASCTGMVAKVNPLMDHYSIQRLNDPQTQTLSQEQIAFIIESTLNGINWNAEHILRRLNANRNYLKMR